MANSGADTFDSNHYVTAYMILWHNKRITLLPHKQHTVVIMKSLL
jgi:hypothetical protein